MELRHLTTLHEPTPLGIDPGCAPYFGWQLHSETPDTRQIACRLQVCGPDGTVLWDTGRVESGQAAFAKLFETALALPADGSLLFHCTAGKDRTGLSAALLLLALGVPLATVRQDYLLSNTTNQAFVDRYLAQIEREGRSATFRTNFQAVATVNGDYLDRALETINDRFGGVATYLRDVLQLGAADLASLRANFLQAGYNGDTKEGE